MNPLLKNKVDVSTMNEQERQLFQKYGKLPKKNVLTSMQKERKYFDSGDYAMHKAGVSADLPVGVAIATPERLPHAQPPSLSSSPTNSSAMPAYAHHHAASSASSPPSGSALSPSNSFSVQPSAPGGIAIPGSGVHHDHGSTAGLARSPTGGGHSPNASCNAAGLGGSGLTARRPSAGVGVASIPIPGVSVGGGFDTSRISPPVALSPLGGAPQSSFPIQTSHATGPGQSSAHVGSIGAHAANMQPTNPTTGAHHHSGSIGHGSSPVKPSNLKRGFDSGAVVVDEQAVED